MIRRDRDLSTSQSFFLFGARGTGKTSLVKSHFSDRNTSELLYIDLLNLDLEAQYQLNPELLYKELLEQPQVKTVVIDEIQKVPKLLDVAHRIIEERGLQFVLTGSSARKLKLGGANLLAGRAVVFNLYPFLASELKDDFHLHTSLSFGTLPRVFNLSDPKEKKRSLKAYANTYIKEEVWGEQLVRKIEPFRRFLQIAAQMHGQPVNYSKIARDVGVDDTSVRSYYSILEDTLLGFFLPAYDGSERKKLRRTPKFYLFDNGVKRALDGSLDYELQPGSFEYGTLFEQLVIAEISRRLSYLERELQLSFLASEGGGEVDLVLEQAGKVVMMIEIKSANKISTQDLKHLNSFSADFKGAKLFCLYGGEVSYREGDIRVLPWIIGVEEVIGFVMKKI